MERIAPTVAALAHAAAARRMLPCISTARRTAIESAFNNGGSKKRRGGGEGAPLARSCVESYLCVYHGKMRLGEERRPI